MKLPKLNDIKRFIRELLRPTFYKKFILILFIIISLYLYIKKMYLTRKFFLIPWKLNDILFIVVSSVFILSIITLICIFNNYQNYKKIKSKSAPLGDTGSRGNRGTSGKSAECLGVCGKSLCYNKILDHITTEINKWKLINKKPKNSLILEGKHLNNRFIKEKVTKLCNSKKYKKNLKNVGAEKIDNYIKKMWSSWINIILKYEKGDFFLESENLNDNDFDKMIMPNDKKLSNFDQRDKVGTPSEGELSPFDEIKKYDLWYWGENSMLRPKVINKCTRTTTIPSNMKRIPRLSIKTSNDYKPLWDSLEKRNRKFFKGTTQKYCAAMDWYCSGGRCGNHWHGAYKPWHCQWGSSCRYGYSSGFGSGPGYKGGHCRQWKQYCKKTANRCIYSIDHEILDKGDKDLSVYRPQRFIDDKNSLFHKEYFPVGDVALSGKPSLHRKTGEMTNEEITKFDNLKEKLDKSLKGVGEWNKQDQEKLDELNNKVNNGKCLPVSPLGDTNCKEVNPGGSDPYHTTLLVSGDVKPPLDYELMYSSQRHLGNYKTPDIRNTGYHFWKPIPPEGYVCLGDVVTVGFSQDKPSTDLIRCVPKKCTRSVSGSGDEGHELWDSEKLKPEYATEGTDCAKLEHPGCTAPSSNGESLLGSQACLAENGGVSPADVDKDNHTLNLVDGYKGSFKNTNEKNNYAGTAPTYTPTWRKGEWEKTRTRLNKPTPTFLDQNGNVVNAINKNKQLGAIKEPSSTYNVNKPKRDIDSWMWTYGKTGGKGIKLDSNNNNESKDGQPIVFKTYKSNSNKPKFVQIIPSGQPNSCLDMDMNKRELSDIYCKKIKNKNDCNNGPSSVTDHKYYKCNWHDLCEKYTSKNSCNTSVSPSNCLWKANKCEPTDPKNKFCSTLDVDKPKKDINGISSDYEKWIVTNKVDPDYSVLNVYKNKCNKFTNKYDCMNSPNEYNCDWINEKSFCDSKTPK